MTSEEYIVQLRDELKKLGGIRPLGEEYIRITGQSAPAGGVDYVGQTATRAMYADLWAWVQENKPGSIISEDEWQALYASQNGNVPYYSTGDGSTTFRFPRMVGYPKFAGSVDEAGKFVQEGLPNISGTFSIINHNPNIGHAFTGAFGQATVGSMPLSGMTDGVSWNEGWGTVTEYFNASGSNAIYGNSDHVTPETVCIIAGVIAFGVPSAVGQADKEGILSELELHGTELELHGTELAALEANKADAKVDGKGVVRTVNGNSADGNGNVSITIPPTPQSYIIERGSHYRKWSDGWLEQWGGVGIPVRGSATVSFSKAFANSYYVMLVTGGGYSNTKYYYTSGCGVSGRATTYATVYQTNDDDGCYFTDLHWYACGY